MVQTIFFDMDGVVIDSEPIHSKSTELVLDKYDIIFPLKIFDDFKGKTDDVFFHHVATNLDNCGRPSSFFINAKNNFFAELVSDVKFVDGFMDFYDNIKKKGIKTALVSSTSIYSLELIDKVCNIKGLFDVIITAADTLKHKPCPEPYLKALDKLPTNLESVVVIEDSVTGIISAKKAGLFVYGITTSFPSEPLIHAGADKIVESYFDLICEIDAS